MASAEEAIEVEEVASEAVRAEADTEEGTMESQEVVDKEEVQVEEPKDHHKVITKLIGLETHLMMAMKKKSPILPGEHHLLNLWSQQMVGPMSRVRPPPKKINHPRSKEEVLCGAQQQ
jgi:hypothetical protein